MEQSLAYFFTAFLEAGMKLTNKHIRFGILFLFTAMLGGRTGYGQAVYGAIIDTSGAVIPNAKYE